MKKKSELFSLVPKDFLKGLVTAVFSAISGYLIVSFQSGSFAINWTTVGTIAASAALGYLSKNFISNSDSEILKK